MESHTAWQMQFAVPPARIPLSCPCGARLSVIARLLDETIECPACHKELIVRKDVVPASKSSAVQRQKARTPAMPPGSPIFASESSDEPGDRTELVIPTQPPESEAVQPLHKAVAAVQRSRIQLLKLVDTIRDLFGYTFDHPAAAVNSAIEEFVPKSVVTLESESRFPGTQQHLDELLSKGKICAVKISNSEVGYVIDPAWLDRLVAQSKSTTGITEGSVSFATDRSPTDVADTDLSPTFPPKPFVDSEKGVDIFGRRHGHGAAYMNTFLSESTPQTVRSLTELSGFNNTPSLVLQLKREGKIEAVFLPDGQIGWVISSTWLKSIEQPTTLLSVEEPTEQTTPFEPTETKPVQEQRQSTPAAPDNVPPWSGVEPRGTDSAALGTWRRPVRRSGRRSSSSGPIDNPPPIDNPVEEPTNIEPAGPTLPQIPDRVESDAGLDQRQKNAPGTSKGFRRPAFRAGGFHPSPQADEGSADSDTAIAPDESSGKADDLSKGSVIEASPQEPPFPNHSQNRWGRPRKEKRVADTDVAGPTHENTPLVSFSLVNETADEDRSWIQRLSPAQRLVFDFIETQIRASSEPPTIREIQAVAKLSYFETLNHVDALVANGIIEFDRSSSRGIRVIPESERFLLPPSPQPDQLTQTYAEPSTIMPQQAHVAEQRPAISTAFSNTGAESLPVSSSALRSAPEWVEQLLASELLTGQYNLAGRRAPGRDQLKLFLMLVAEHGYVVQRETVCHALSLPVIRYSGFVSMIMRLLNLDNVPIVTRDESGDTIRTNFELLCRQFGIAR